MEEYEEYYAECRRPHKNLDCNFDGCQEFITSKRFSTEFTPCCVCDCFRSYHRKVVPVVKKVVVEHKMEVVYTRCQKIHPHNTVDGCQEFVLSTMEDLSCATCGCHKNFHRNEIITSTTTTTTTTT